MIKYLQKIKIYIIMYNTFNCITLVHKQIIYYQYLQSTHKKCIGTVQLWYCWNTLYTHWIQYDVWIISKYLKCIFGLTSAYETKINSLSIQSSKLSNLRETNYVYNIPTVLYTNKKLANTAVAIVFIKDNHVSLLKQRATQKRIPGEEIKKHVHTSRISR